jgi:hypothetical protein
MKYLAIVPFAFAVGIAAMYGLLYLTACSLDDGWVGRIVYSASHKIGFIRRRIWQTICAFMILIG